MCTKEANVKALESQAALFKLEMDLLRKEMRDMVESTREQQKSNNGTLLSQSARSSNTQDHGMFSNAEVNPDLRQTKSAPRDEQGPNLPPSDETNVITESF